MRFGATALVFGVPAAAVLCISAVVTVRGAQAAIATTETRDK